MAGWISIHRQIWDSWVWEEKPFSRGQAWIDLLLLANHEDKKVCHNGSLVEVKRGERITSIKQLEGRWGWSNRKVKRYLDMLQEDGMIVYKSTTKKTTYTIVNYNVWQGEEGRQSTTEALQKHNKSTTEAQQKHTNNNDNNINNINKALEEPDLYSKIIFSWNSLGLQELKVIQNKRKQLLDARLKEHGEESIKQAIENIKTSSFLKGQNKNSWIITFDWLVRPNNYIKVLEGNYSDKPVATTKKARRPMITRQDASQPASQGPIKEAINKKLLEDFNKLNGGM